MSWPRNRTASFESRPPRTKRRPQSRLAVASANLQSNVDATRAAESRITDVDVAEEAARLVSTDILQQTVAAVLAHANQEPALALKLLGR